MRAQRKKEKEEEEQKGFDAIEASFLEKGLIAAGSGRSMGAKAIGEVHAHRERHSAEREKTHRAEFVTRENSRAAPKRAEFTTAILSGKKRTKRNQPTQQSKRQDIDDPSKEKKR